MATKSMEKIAKGGESGWEKQDILVLGYKESEFDPFFLELHIYHGGFDLYTPDPSKGSPSAAYNLKLKEKCWNSSGTFPFDDLKKALEKLGVVNDMPQIPDKYNKVPESGDEESIE